MDSAAFLPLLDVRIELRSLSGNRWVALPRFFNEDGSLNLLPGEVLTKIRIPMDEWNIKIYKKIGGYREPGGGYLSFSAIGKTQRNILGDFRFSFSFGGTTILRNKEIEALLNGRSIPLSEKAKLLTLNVLQNTLENMKEIDPFSGARAFRLFKWVISKLHEE